MGLQVLSDGVHRWFALRYPGFGAQRADVYWPHAQILLVEWNCFCTPTDSYHLARLLSH